MKRCLVALLAVALFVAGERPVRGGAQIPPFGAPGEFSADLRARRIRAMANLGPDTVLILWSAPVRVYSNDVNYEYRQESNLLYLSGITQPDTILVLIPGAQTTREILFTREGDSRRELWEGHTLTPDEIRATSGVSTVVPQRSTEVFDQFLTALFGQAEFPRGTAAGDADFAAFRQSASAGRARLAVIDDADDDADARSPQAGSRAAWAASFAARYQGVTTATMNRALLAQRQVKTPYEQKVLTRSVEISAQAHVEGMKAAKPGRWEYEVEAAIEFWFHKHGMLSWGYPSIVGSGPNATILHYLDATRQMRDGDLLLVDAAGNYQGLTGDITRTYPVSGRFTPEQRALYELVLRAQEAGIAAARPNVRPAAVNAATRAVFAEGLATLGLVIPGHPGLSVERQVSLWFPHGPVHGIGVDVHDPLGDLVPGAAFVIEPGLYIRPDALDALPRTPDYAAFIAAVRPAMTKYANMGIRIEDSFLMSDSGPVNLSTAAPKTVAELERLVGTGP